MAPLVGPSAAQVPTRYRGSCEEKVPVTQVVHPGVAVAQVSALPSPLLLFSSAAIVFPNGCSAVPLQRGLPAGNPLRFLPSGYRATKWI